jgi:hypothetical protein
MYKISIPHITLLILDTSRYLFRFDPDLFSGLKMPLTMGKSIGNEMCVVLLLLPAHGGK